MMESKQLWLNSSEIVFKFIFPIVLEAMEDGLNEGIDRLEAELGVTFDRSFINETALSMAQVHSLDLATGITETTRGIFQKYASEWIESGEPLQTLLDRLAPVFGRVRAEAIGITEITRIYSHSNAESWRQTGFIDTAIVETVMDDLVCPICEPKQGEEVSLDAGNDNLPPFHTRCRCYIKPKSKQ